VLTVVGQGEDLAAASEVAERAADAIHWPGMQRRRDIGWAAGAGAAGTPARSGLVIRRYTLPEMGAVWTDKARFEGMLRVEIAVARAQSKRGLIPADALTAIEEHATVDVDRIAEIEQTTDHDVIAFVSQVAESVGPDGRYLHLGLTSSDVVDTGLALQLRGAGQILIGDCDRLLAAIIARARAEAETVMMGRTHSVHAEPITLGHKLAGWAFELDRGRRRLAQAVDEAGTARSRGLSGRTATSARTSRPTSSRSWTSTPIPPQPRSSSATATRRCSRRSRSSAAASSGSRPRSGTSSTPRSASSRSRSRPVRRARRRCPTSATRSSASGSPASRGCCAATPTPRSRPAALARARHQPQLRRAVILPDATILLDYMLVRTTGLIERPRGPRRADAREHRAGPRPAREQPRPRRARRARRALARDAYAIVQRAA
jgi:adenylosuccinate lyase